MGQVTVMLVDDDVELLANLGAWLEAAGYRVHGARSGHEAIALARVQPLDVAVIDLQMPGFSGLELLALLKQLDERIEVIILSGLATLDDAVAALRHGRAFDLLQKPLRDPRELTMAIEQATIRRHHRSSSEPAAPLALPALSDREREIVAWLVTGAEIREIADRVCLSEKTVRNYLSQIYGKLGVGNRTQAILACQRLKLS